MFTIENVVYNRGKQEILDNLSFSIEPHKLTSLIGPSGCGKSTLLGLLTGRIKPLSGKIYYKDIVVNECDQKTLLEIRKKMSIMFQSGALFTDLSVFENVEFPIEEILDLSKEDRDAKVKEILTLLNLWEARHKLPSELSGGMKYRLAFAKTIATDPDVIMFDEPFVGQDPLIRVLMIDLITKLKAKNKTIILVSHDIKEALYVSDRTLFLYNKNIIFNGLPSDLKKLDVPVVREFLEGDLLDV